MKSEDCEDFWVLVEVGSNKLIANFGQDLGSSVVCEQIFQFVLRRIMLGLRMIGMGCGGERQHAKAR
tara:strand:- start:377 stop:577 length:201 start_codon:yes stop_codon:yes gene_type:complete